MENPTPISLHTNARQNFLSWRSSTIEAYGQACVIYYRHGLLGFLLPDTAWANLPGNSITTEQEDDLPAVITIAQRPTLPEFTPLAAAATAAQQSAWDRNTKILKHVRENYDALKLQLINSVSADDIAILRNPTTAYLHVTPQAILVHISALHGTLDNNDYVQLTLTLQALMTTTDTISGIVARHRHIHEQFQSSNQALSEYQKCSYFRNAVNHHQHMRSAYESYVVSTPLVGAQTFLTLTTHIIAQAPNFTATAADMGYTALVTSTIPEYFQSPAFAALLTRTVQHAIAPASASANQKKADSGNKNPVTIATCMGITTRTVAAIASRCLLTALYTPTHT